MIDTCEVSASSVYAVLPSVIRSRLPILPSVRQSARDALSRPLLQSGAKSAEERAQGPCSANCSRRRSASSLIVTSSATSSSDPLSRPASPVNGQVLESAIQLDRPTMNRDVNVDGVDWTVAAVGVQLWLNARGQADLGARDPTLLRSMYIDALKYMNMALPRDLSRIEVEIIQGSLPSQILHQHDQLRQIIVAPKRHALRQGVAQVVCWIVAMILLIVPLVMTTTNKLLIYESRHQVTRRAIDRGARAVRVVGAKALDIGNGFVWFKDTAFGKTCFEAMLWVVEGFVGGLNDGLIRSINSSDDRVVPYEQRS